MERAEDNAVIRLALAKLNPSQREALVASIYEEKSSEEIADQLGLSSNAARQLLFRARGAFRKALVGEAEIRGKSISQVLTIAAKKAAVEAKDNGVKLGAFIVLIAIGLGTLTSFVPSKETVFAESLVIESPAQVQQPTPPPVLESGSANGVDNTFTAPKEGHSNISKIPEPTEEEAVFEDTLGPSQTSESLTATVVGQELDQQIFSTILSTNVDNAGIYTNGGGAPLGIAYQGVVVEVFGGTGISAFIDLNTESKTVTQILFKMLVDNDTYYGVAKSTDIETLDNGRGYTIAVLAKEFFVVDDMGNVSSESPSANSKAAVALELAENGTPESASLAVESTG